MRKRILILFVVSLLVLAASAQAALAGVVTGSYDELNRDPDSIKISVGGVSGITTTMTVGETIRLTASATWGDIYGTQYPSNIGNAPGYSYQFWWLKFVWDSGSATDVVSITPSGDYGQYADITSHKIGVADISVSLYYDDNPNDTSNGTWLKTLNVSSFMVTLGVNHMPGDFDNINKDTLMIGIEDVSNPPTAIGQTGTMTASASWYDINRNRYPRADYPGSMPGLSPNAAYAYWYRYWGLKLDWSATTPGVVSIEQYGEYGQNLRLTALKSGRTDIVVRLVRVSDPSYTLVSFTQSIVVGLETNKLFDYKVEMSGIPNTMTIIGQTSSLTAGASWSYNWGLYYPGDLDPAESDIWIVRYPRPWLDSPNSPYAPTDPTTVAYWYEYWGLALRWGSSNPSVAAITEQYGAEGDNYGQYAHLVSYREGTTHIFVELVAKANPTVVLARDSVQLDVTSKISYTNVHPDVARLLGLYNTNMLLYNEQLGFAESNPANVATQSFQSAFTSRFGLSASQVTEIPDANSVAFDSTASFAKSGYEQIKPSMRIAVSSLASAGGTLLPVAFTYNLSWSEVSETLGREVTSLSDYSELFGKLGIVFEGESGAAVPVIDGSSYAKAVSAGDLQIMNDSGGLTLSLDVMLADVNAGTADRAEWIGDSLVVPDGKADGTSGGSMWLVKKAGGNGTNTPAGSGGGGGGGCDAGAGCMLLAALGMVFGLRRR